MSSWWGWLGLVARSSVLRSLRYPLVLGVLSAFGYLAVVVVNQGRSVLGTLTVAFFVGCGVTLAAYFWRDSDRPLRGGSSKQGARGDGASTGDQSGA